MRANKQNPGVPAGVLRVVSLSKGLRVFSTTSERQAQMLACRFCLPLSTARALASLWYGEGHDD